MIVFLNLTGVIDAKTHGGLFHIEGLADLTLEGRIFDPNGFPATLIGVV
jgi:hypothetical protein